MKYIFFSLLLGFAVTENCFGQAQILIGPLIDLNFNHYQTSSFPFPDLNPPVISVQDGNGIASKFGISCELPIDADNKNMMTFDISYDSKSGAFNSASADNVYLVTTGGVKKSNISTDLKAELSYLILAIGYKYNFREAPIPVGPGIQLSLYAGLNLMNNFDRTITITSNDTVYYSKLETKTTIQGIHSLRFGVRGQFSWDIPVRYRYKISPFVGYDLPFTKVDDSEKSWKASSFYAGIAVHFSIDLESRIVVD